MHKILYSLLLFISFLFVFNLSNAGERGENFKISVSSLQVAYKTIIVEKNGYGHFTKVQEAIDSIPSGNNQCNQWVRIYVHPGVYMEKVNIDRDKPCILLEGSSSRETIIAWDGSARTDISATFTSSSNNFVAKSITFQNSFDCPIGKVEGLIWKPAVAASIHGDRSAFYDCSFIGFQDTLWDAIGRHYFKSCYIEGAVDFIWGSAQSVFEDVLINVTSSRLAPVASAGYITAQGRNSVSDPSGFMFLRGKITGNGKVYLGRAYRPYSRVVFQETEMDAIVVPQGWDAWHYVGHEKIFVYAEVHCRGPGSELSKRVAWERNSSDTELQNFMKSLFSDSSGWLSYQPSIQENVSLAVKNLTLKNLILLLIATICSSL